MEIAERAVRLDEEEPQAHFVVAVALLWLREHERALAEAQRCIALAPNFAEGHIGDRSHSDLRRQCRGSYQIDGRLHETRSLV